MSTAPHTSTAASKERAKGRWKILRDALLKPSPGEGFTVTTSPPRHSIHSFPGYNLLRESSLSIDDISSIESNLSLWRFDGSGSWFQQVENAVLIHFALMDTNFVECAAEHFDRANGSITLTFQFSDSSDTSVVSRELDHLVNVLRSSHAIQVLASSMESTESGHLILRLQLQRVRCDDMYYIAKYSIPVPGTDKSLLVRQRHRRVRLSLKELASHQFNGGVDNTGNVCVWDAEKTLTWALLNDYYQQSMSHVKRITELGAGMAGLAALAFAAVSGEVEEVRLTDGHMDCVKNNQVNALLFQQANPKYRTRFVAQQLLWTMDDLDQEQRGDQPADMVLVSDCTHFEEYHGALLWTLIQCSAVGGTIWMCQPHRGRSWGRFSDLLAAVNHGTTERVNPLLGINERRFTELDDIHDQFMRRPDMNYDENIHRPRIFCLEKLRRATDADRQIVIRHMVTRDATEH